MPILPAVSAHPDVGCTIRLARPEDYDGIQPLAEQMDALHREHLPERFRKHDGPPRSREYVMSLIEDDETMLAVAESDGTLVGIINCGLSRTPDIPIKVRRLFVKVRGVVVDRAYRRRGIGRVLMERAADWAREHGASEVQLNLYAYNEDGAAFYRALGFSVLSSRLVRPVSG